MEHTKTYSAFNGQVTFELATRNTLRSRAVLADLVGAVPELDDWPSTSVMRRYFTNFAVFIAAVRKITFAPTLTKDVLIEFQKWWEAAQVAMRFVQYRAMWDAYMELPEDAVNDLIAEAYNNTRDDFPAPPEVLAPGSEEAALEDPNLQDAVGSR